MYVCRFLNPYKKKRTKSQKRKDYFLFTIKNPNPKQDHKYMGYLIVVEVA